LPLRVSVFSGLAVIDYRKIPMRRLSPMNVLLPTELEKFVTEKIQSGLFLSANDVILEGLKLLKERDEAQGLRREELRQAIQIGIDQADAGRVSNFDESTLEEIKTRGRQRLASARDRENQ
jgi:antitoxin ParD1/3/4